MSKLLQLLQVLKVYIEYQFKLFYYWIELKIVLILALTFYD